MPSGWDIHDVPVYPTARVRQHRRTPAKKKDARGSVLS